MSASIDETQDPTDLFGQMSHKSGREGIPEQNLVTVEKDKNNDSCK